MKDNMVKNRLSITLPAGSRVLGLSGGPARLNPLINPTDFTRLLIPSELFTFQCACLDKCLRTWYPELNLSLRLALFVHSFACQLFISGFSVVVGAGCTRIIIFAVFNIFTHSSLENSIANRDF